MPDSRQKNSVGSASDSPSVKNGPAYCNGEHTVKLFIYCWDWEQQDYSRLFSRKQSMTGLGMMCYRGDTVHGFVLSIKQTAVRFILMSSYASPSRVFNFLTMSFNVSYLSPPPLFCLFTTAASSSDSSSRPQRAQLSSNQYNWVTMQLEWTLGLSSLWKMSILLPLIFGRLTVGLGSCDITFVSASLRGLEWQNLISCRIKQFAFNLGVKG